MHDDALSDRGGAVPAIGEESGPITLRNVCSDAIKHAIDLVPESLLVLSDGELSRTLKPTPVDVALRMAFWRRFEMVAVGRAKQVTPIHVYSGVCSEAYFRQKVLTDPLRVAWLIHPFEQYANKIDAVLFDSIDRLWQFVRMDVSGPDGRECPRRVEVVHKIIVDLMNRRMGMAVQRTENKSLNVNVDKSRSYASGMSLEEARADEARKRELEEKLYGKRVVAAPGGGVVGLPPANQEASEERSIDLSVEGSAELAGRGSDDGALLPEEGCAEAVDPDVGDASL